MPKLAATLRPEDLYRHKRSSSKFLFCMRNRLNSRPMLPEEWASELDRKLTGRVSAMQSAISVSALRPSSNILICRDCLPKTSAQRRVQQPYMPLCGVKT